MRNFFKPNKLYKIKKDTTGEPLGIFYLYEKPVVAHRSGEFPPFFVLDREVNNMLVTSKPFWTPGSLLPLGVGESWRNRRNFFIRVVVGERIGWLCLCNKTKFSKYFKML